MKTFILIFSLFFSSFARAELTYQWLGTTGVIISDGKTVIAFDPTITRPSFFQILFNNKIKSDTALVDEKINSWKIPAIDAFFLSHEHFDHALDIGVFVKKNNGKLFGTKSVMNLGTSLGVPAEKLKLQEVGQTVQVGNFKITSFPSPHPKIFRIFNFAPGEITTPFTGEANVNDFKVGDSVMFNIVHPEGKIFFQQNGTIPDVDGAKNLKTDFLFQTLANRKSSEDIIVRRVIPMNPKKIIIMHHDNFFEPVNEVDMKLLPFIRINEFKEVLHKSAPQIILEEPVYGKKVKLN